MIRSFAMFLAIHFMAHCAPASSTSGSELKDDSQGMHAQWKPRGLEDARDWIQKVSKQSFWEMPLAPDTYAQVLEGLSSLLSEVNTQIREAQPWVSRTTSEGYFKELYATQEFLDLFEDVERKLLEPGENQRTLLLYRYYAELFSTVVEPAVQYGGVSAKRALRIAKRSSEILGVRIQLPLLKKELRQVVKRREVHAQKLYVQFRQGVERSEVERASELLKSHSYRVERAIKNGTTVLRAFVPSSEVHRMHREIRKLSLRHLQSTRIR